VSGEYLAVKKIDINIHHLARVEGHANLIVRGGNGRAPRVRWEVIEPPRFFEVMLRGRPWHDAHVLASRICGICSVSHQLASIQATETAFGIQPSEHTLALRKLLYAGEVIESHVLHLYFLALPDFMRAGSVFPLMESHRDVVLRGLRLKKLGNDIMTIIGGRPVHPQAAQVGGFGRLPSRQDLRLLNARLKEAMPDLEETVALFKQLRLPDFRRETEFIALKHPDEYAFIRGDISSTDTGVVPREDYLEITNEYRVPHSTAKFTRHARASYVVGALARINNNLGQLHPLARQVAEEFGLEPVTHRPFLNNAAQVVEVIHEVEEAAGMIDRLLADEIRVEDMNVSVKAGRGVGVVEAPRGLLLHEYTYDERGHITAANCVIPTGQNHGSIQEDLELLVSLNSGKTEDELRLLCEMLVRSYDPCISCSTH
jgi:sulfhydrogenase subunit alpha